MKKIILIFPLLIFIFTSGCHSGKRIGYDSLQKNRQLECSQMINDRARAECMEGVSTPYDTYRIEQENAQNR